MDYSTDKYGGITIDAKSISKDLNRFEQELKDLLTKNSNAPLFWITLPRINSHYIPSLTKEDFLFFSCKENSIMLYKKNLQNINTPTPVNHTVAIGSVVIHDNKILVIKDRFNPLYKLPSGSIEESETISETVIREIKEETGVDAKIKSVLGLSHITSSQFGESNVYLICLAEALTTEINIIDTQEILEAKWMDLEEFLESDEVHKFLKTIVKETKDKDGLEPIDLNVEFKHEMFL